MPACKRVTVSLDALDDAVFRRMNDVDFPVADVLRGIDAAQRVGPGADQGQHGGQARHQRRRRSCRWRATSRHSGRGAALHRIHGRRRHQRLAHGRSAAVGRGACGCIARALPLRAARAPTTPGETAERWALRRRRRRDRRHHQRHPGVLRRLQPRPAVDRRQAVLACSPAAATTCARCCAAAPATTQLLPPSASIWRGRDDRYSELRSTQHGRPPTAANDASRCTTSAAEAQPAASPRHDTAAKPGSDRRLHQRLRPERAAGRAGAGIHRPVRAAGAGGRERRDARERWAACWRATSSRPSTCRRTTTRRWTATRCAAPSCWPTQPTRCCASSAPAWPASASTARCRPAHACAS